MENSEQDQLNMSLYLAPEQLTANEANEKARPAEKPEDRARRVADMAASILANGQEYPVLVVEASEGDVTTYEYVDGGCRVEAIAKLNEENGKVPRQVWCSLVDPKTDLFRQAVVANLHRTQNSLADMGHIVQEAFDRNGWRGRGANKKVAEYLGMTEPRVSELMKVVQADGPLKKMIDSGEVQTLDAALKILQTPEEKREEVTTRARQIAAEDEEEEKPKKGKSGKSDEPKELAAPKKVKAKHVEQAKRDTGVEKSPRAKSEIAEFFEKVSAAAYGPKTVAFAEYFVEKWMAGEGTDRKARELFDAMVAGDKPAKVKAEGNPSDKISRWPHGKQPKAPKAAKKAAPKKKK